MPVLVLVRRQCFCTICWSANAGTEASQRGNLTLIDILACCKYLDVVETTF